MDIIEMATKDRISDLSIFWHHFPASVRIILSSWVCSSTQSTNLVLVSPSLSSYIEKACNVSELCSCFLEPCALHPRSTNARTPEPQSPHLQRCLGHRLPSLASWRLPASRHRSALITPVGDYDDKDYDPYYGYHHHRHRHYYG